MPIVSILIPVFNREHLIGSAIESALAQTVTDFEIIIVDNQSTDRTLAICKSFAATDHRIRLYQNSENIGPVLNWIRCVEYATAPFAKILFSDDLMAPNYLERTLPYMLSPECALVYTQAIIGNESWKGTVFYETFLSDCKISRNYFFRAATHLGNFYPASPGAALFRTSDLHKNILTSLPGFDDYDFLRYGAGVDWLIYMLTALYYPHIAYVAEPLVYFRAHPDSITIKNEDNMVSLGYAAAKQWLTTMLPGL